MKMTTRAIVALGVGQCVNWGVLYYAFGVLLAPLERDLGVPGWVLASAFSLALLMAALTAPIVGAWTDRGAGPRLMRGGGYAAALLFLLLAVAPSLPSFFILWAALGVCMAATLYEPVFAIIGRALHEPTVRLRALATVTVLGGLASTVFLPLTALLVESWGWRATVCALASTLAVSTLLCSNVPTGTLEADRASSQHAADRATDARLPALLGLFGAASLATTAFTTTLVPALVTRELSPVTSASLAGLLGIMQLPGRALVMRGSLHVAPPRLVLASLSAQAVGIAITAVSSGPLPLATGVTIFAVGAGLMTLARPHLVHTVFPIHRTGHINGRLASIQNLARAGGPVFAVGLASVVGYAVTFGVLAMVTAVLAAVSRTAIEG